MVARIHSSFESAKNNIHSWKQERNIKNTDIYIIEHTWFRQYTNEKKHEYSFSLTYTTKAVAVLKAGCRYLEVYSKY